jgi:hypothetical protein
VPTVRFLSERFVGYGVLEDAYAGDLDLDHIA